MFMRNFIDIDFDKLTKQIDEMQNNAVSNVDMKKVQSVYESLIKEAADARINLEKSDSLLADYFISLLDSGVETLNKVYESFKKHVDAVKKSNPVADIVEKEVKREVDENKGKVNCNCNKEATDKCECTNEVSKLPDGFVYPSSKLTSKQKRNVQNLVDEYMNEMIIPYLPDNYNEDAVDDMESGLFEFGAWVLNK